MESKLSTRGYSGSLDIPEYVWTVCVLICVVYTCVCVCLRICVRHAWHQRSPLKMRRYLRTRTDIT